MRGEPDVADLDNARVPLPFLQQLAAQLRDARAVGVALTGSYSRGMATQDSDIDFMRVVDALPADGTERSALRAREGWLVSSVTTTFADLAQAFERPERAVWGVPLLRDAHIFYDPTGQLAHLKQEARAFHWEPLQAAADAYASQRLLKFVEEANGLVGALRRDDAEHTMTETMWLVLGLPLVVAVQRGILLLNETRAPQQVQQAVGVSSLWARSYRVAAGLEPDQAGQHSVRARGIAGLCLYVTTVGLLRPVLQPEHAEIVDSVLAKVRGAGFGVDSERSDA
jgi:hypothetical protein